MKMAPQTDEELDDLASEPDRGVIATVERIDGDVVVAGAGGKMGYHLCLMLRRTLDILGSSNRVIAVSRFGEDSVRERFEARSIETISADLTDPEVVAKLPDAAALFYLAGRKFGTSDDPESLRLFNEVMPGLVADRYAGANLVALSTGCVYPFVEPSSGGSTEEDATAPVGGYAESCLGREKAFLRSSEEHRSPLSFIRLNYSVDLRYGVLVDLALKVKQGEPVDLTTGWFNCIWQGDAVMHTIRSLDEVSPAPDACLMNVTGARILSVRDVAEQFGERFDLPVSFTGVPADTAWLNNARKSHRLFGSPAIPESVLIAWVADWIDRGGSLLGKSTNFDVRNGDF